MNNQQALFESEPLPVRESEAKPLLSNVAIPVDDGRTIEDWLSHTRFESLLSELVIRAKTIEANVLHSAGTKAKLEYLLRAYDGDEILMKADLIQLGSYLRTPTKCAREWG
jgi:hypothetical protein